MLTNYFRSDQKEKDWSLFSKNVLMGVSASLLIPLFLNLISSNLLKESASASLKYFIFFGFCLIASLSSKAFIQTISDRLLKEVKETEDKVEDIKKEVGPFFLRKLSHKKNWGKSRSEPAGVNLFLSLLSGIFTEIAFKK